MFTCSGFRSSSLTCRVSGHGRKSVLWWGAQELLEQELLGLHKLSVTTAALIVKSSYIVCVRAHADLFNTPPKGAAYRGADAAAAKTS
eukprot:4528618-Pyramimonas_sp.AAC.1